MRMQLMVLALTLAAASSLSGCDLLSSESQADSAYHVPQTALNFLSTEGDLFPLSAYYGVCTKYVGVWRTMLHSGPFNPHEPTGGEITVVGGISLKISVGKFSMWSDAEFKDISDVSPGKRLQIGHDRFGNYILVSGFDGAGNNRVSIEYDKTNMDAQAAALRLANNVVACRVSAVPSP